MTHTLRGHRFSTKVLIAGGRRAFLIDGAGDLFAEAASWLWSFPWIDVTKQRAGSVRCSYSKPETTQQETLSEK